MGDAAGLALVRLFRMIVAWLCNLLWVSDWARAFSRWLRLLGLSLSVSLCFSFLPFLLLFLSFVFFFPFVVFLFAVSFGSCFQLLQALFVPRFLLAMFFWAFFAWVYYLSDPFFWPKGTCPLNRWLCLIGLSISVSLCFSLLPFLLLCLSFAFSLSFSGSSSRYFLWVLFSDFAGSLCSALFSLCSHGSFLRGFITS